MTIHTTSLRPDAPAIPRAPSGPPIGFDALPDGVSAQHVTFVAADGARSQGMLYGRGGERSVAFLTHPRGDFTRHYMTPALLEAGYAVCGFKHRAGVSDAALTREMMLLDMAGAIGALKAERGYDKVVLLANCGGGPISGFYQWQAEARLGERLTHTAAGDPLDLNTVDLPAADGLIVLAAPFSLGELLLESIDPSVTDEDDPLSCDPSLDMYDPQNGYREPPQSSAYAPEFVARYRAAQSARVARIEDHARSLIAEQRRQQALMREPGFAALGAGERSWIRRQALDTRPIIAYRNEARLAYCDLSMLPSKRAIGTFLSLDPLAANYTRGPAEHFMSPRAWLSAHSSTSRSSLRLALPNIGAPTLIINYTADAGVYPAHGEEMLALSGAADKALRMIDGDHFGMPAEGLGEPDPRGRVAVALADWLNERFPGR
jgi:hypothetical protein